MVDLGKSWLDKICGQWPVMSIEQSEVNRIFDIYTESVQYRSCRNLDLPRFCWFSKIFFCICHRNLGSLKFLRYLRAWDKEYYTHHSSMLYSPHLVFIYTTQILCGPRKNLCGLRKILVDIGQRNFFTHFSWCQLQSTLAYNNSTIISPIIAQFWVMIHLSQIKIT